MDEVENIYAMDKLKDIIIINGRPLYLQDIELSVFSSYPDLIEHGCAVFSMQIREKEHLIIAQEINRYQKNFSKIFYSILNKIITVHNIVPYKIILVLQGTLPTIFNGMIARCQCRQKLKESKLDIVAQWINPVFTDKAMHEQLKASHHLLLDEKILSLSKEKIYGYKSEIASFGQERLWFLCQLNANLPIYNIGIAYLLTGKLNLEAFEAAINSLMERHESLRTNLKMIDNHLQQIIIENIFFDISVNNIAHGNFLELFQSELRKPFNLAQDILIRCKLFRRCENEFFFTIVMHHTISDGWSVQIFLKELCALYNAYQQGLPSPLKPLVYQYRDFAYSQHEWFANVRPEFIGYWQQRLRSLPEALSLPTDYPRVPNQAYIGKSSSFKLSPDLSDRLHEYCAAGKVSLFTFLFAGFSILLHRYTAKNDIIIGMPSLGRKNSQHRRQIGFYVNTLPVRINLGSNPKFIDFLNQVKTSLSNDYAYQDLPSNRIIQHLSLLESVNYKPLFDVSFALQNFDIHNFHVNDITMKLVATDTGLTLLDLDFEISQNKSALDLSIKYNSTLFEESTIQRMAGHYFELLTDILMNSQKTIGTLNILTLPEKQKLLIEWNSTQIDYQKNTCIHKLFENQVKHTPEAIAVIFEEQQLTYRELNEKSNQIAQYLYKLNFTPESPIVISLDKSIEFVVGLLAILKSGGAYVPLDPKYPLEKINFILTDSKAKILLTTSKYINKFIGFKQVVQLDIDIYHFNKFTFNKFKSNSKNLAYIIYTSGTTGNSKGVLIEHKSVVTLVKNNNYIKFNKNDRGALASNINFDATTFEIWSALLNGAALVIFSENLILNLKSFVEELNNKKITTLWLTAGLFNRLVTEDFLKLKYIKNLIIGGEPVNPKAVLKFLSDKFYKSINLMNGYGPTENTTFTTTCLLSQYNLGKNVFPIGRPIGNTQVYILDLQLQPTPIGIPGEIHIGGAGLARGYLNRPELTKEKFIPNPFSDDPDSRLYKSGDLARYLPDGNIEYLGRIDQQVKIRGFRIEPGEVENALSSYSGIKTCVVIAATVNEDKQLVAYFVSDDTVNIPLNDLRDYLAKKLPHYMIPAYFVPIDKIPLTPNGKIDRNALPEPLSNALRTKQKNTAQNTHIEQRIMQIWESLLHIHPVGVDENFFELGGHSLLLAKMHAKLEEAFNKNIPMMELFNYSTIAKLAKYLEPENTVDILPVTKSETPIASKDTEIAIIGMAGRFPGAQSLAEFWENLCGGTESIKFFSEEELLDANTKPADLHSPNYIKAKGYLEGADLFDAGFFGISDIEAKTMDPQQRIILECVWESLENAGYYSEDYGRIGVFTGVSSMCQYLHKNLLADADISKSVGDYQLFVNNSADFASVRTSYKLNLTGPSYTLLTGCSTSLVAVNIACQSLLNNQCYMALAGGAALSLPLVSGYEYQEGMILSPDGHCRAFDAQAKGTVLGNGAGIVVLKRLADAVADRDTIYAVIKGFATNNDGSAKIGYTAPSQSGQASVIAEAQAKADISPEAISYIEAHGTGTPLGDPIEFSALKQVFNTATSKKQFCALGSVKTNIGHLDTAAGIASLIKTTLSLYHKQLPASLHFSSPNSQIDFSDSPFYINTQTKAWDDCFLPRRAGVSSFGIGGTNAHVILEEAPCNSDTPLNNKNYLIILSAKSENALSTTKNNLLKYLQKNKNINIANVAYTYQVGRKSFVYRYSFICENQQQAIEILSGESESESRLSNAEIINKYPLVFYFTDSQPAIRNNIQYFYQQHPIFKNHFDECANLILHTFNQDLNAAIDTSVEIDEKLLQFCGNYALAHLVLGWGLVPQFFEGQGIGGLLAECLNQKLSLKETILELNNFHSIKLDTNNLRLNNSYLQINTSNFRLINEKAEGITDIETQILFALSTLWLAGYNINWREYNKESPGRRIALPTYAFERQRYWIDASKPLSKLADPIVAQAKNPIDNWFYLPVWQRTKALDINREELKNKTYLIFNDECGVAQKLIENLKIFKKEIIQVVPGNYFSKLSNNKYRINNKEPESFLRLFQALKSLEKLPDVIIYLPTITKNNEKCLNTYYLDDHLHSYFYSLVYLCQALGKISHTNDLKLVVVANYLYQVKPEDEIFPEKATLLGPVQVIPKEYPYIRCQNIDINLPLLSNENHLETLCNNILAEISANQTEQSIAYRNQYRYSLNYKALELAENDSAPLLNDNGVYLITGGLGGIGLTFANYLASAKNAKIILLSRSEFPDPSSWKMRLNSGPSSDPTNQKINKINAIQAKGAEVAVFKCDIANQQDMRIIFEKIKSKYGSINGVVHCAGLMPSGKLIEQHNIKTISEILKPKVSGTLILHELLHKENLDFFVMCSSLSQIFGDYGRVDYCAANLFQDFFAHYCSKKHQRTLAINWDGWQEVGMAADMFSKKQENQYGILPEEGVEVFKRAISYDFPQLVISVTDLDERKKQNANLFAALKISDQNEKMKHYTQAEIKFYIDKLLENYFGPTFNESKNIFDLGGDSLFIIHLSAGLAEYFKINLSPQNFLKNPTSEGICRVIEQSLGLSDVQTLKNRELSFVLVKLKDGNVSHPHLFLMHPVGGTVYLYRDLLKHLPPDLAVYGLQAQSLDGKSSFNLDVKQMASNYLAAIQSIQAKGPYLLGGLSFGGTLAYEIAQQMQRQQQTVGFVCLIDTPGLTQMPLMLNDGAEIIAYFLQQLANHSVPVVILQKMSEQERNQYLLKHLIRNRPSYEIFANVDMSLFLNIFKANMQAMANYKIQPLSKSCKVAFYRAQERDEVNPQHPEAGWQQLFGNQMKLHQVPGNHNTMLFEPNATYLGKLLSEEIERAVATVETIE